jgi:hypothetical protein
MLASTPDRCRSRPQRDAASRLRIVVLGYVIRGPVGGLAWHHLQYVMGLADLGHDVYFVEDSDDYPSCYDPSSGATGIDPSYGLRFASQTLERVGLAARWAYHDAHSQQWLGPCADHILEICGTADIVFNLSGMNPLRAWLSDVPVRILVDTDPVFTQIRQLSDAEARIRALSHTAFFSFGENIGRQCCSIPDDGFYWRPTRQPVVLAAWPVTPGPAQGRFTTVMQWRSYPAREYGGRSYGMKAESFERFLNLPKKAGPLFALAASGVPRSRLRRKGWDLLDPLETARDPWTYQCFIQASKAEFSVAKHGYVVSHSGWFSERSACYLASGRPVVTQDTGFSAWLETGAGVIAFTTEDEALAGIEDVNARYDFHCRAAREIAETYFDAHDVLGKILENGIRRETVGTDAAGCARPEGRQRLE